MPCLLELRSYSPLIQSKSFHRRQVWDAHHFLEKVPFRNFRFRLSDGKRFNWVELSVLTSRSYTQQEPWVLLCIRQTDDMVNMEADRHYQRELEYYCNCDALTGLFNRMKFEKDVSLLNEEHPDTIECVYIDVVGLHEINNHLGHQTGDSMLCMVAGTARSFFPNDRLYRIGGDEFVILCCNRKHDEVLLAVEKLRMTLRGAEYEISVGVQQGTGRENVQNIVNRAEDAMRRDKEAYYQQNGQERRMRSLNEKLERLMQEKQDADRLVDICCASCTLPVLCPVAYVDGVPMVDGGVCDAIPIRHAIDDGFRKNVIVLTRNKGYRKEEKDFWLPGFIYRRYPAIRKQLKLRYRNYNEVLDYIDELEAKGDAIVIRPQKKMEVGRTTNDRKKLSALYDEGYAVGRSIVENNRFDFKTPVI